MNRTFSVLFGFANIVGRAFGIALAVLLLSIQLMAAEPLTPRSDFSQWYLNWLKSLPQSFTMHMEEFNGAPRPATLVMDVDCWKRTTHKLVAVKNSAVRKTFRLLVNESYAAKIEASDADESIWSITGFAFKDDPQYEKLSEGNGASFDFLFGAEELFARPHQVTMGEPDANNHIKAKIVFSRDLSGGNDRVIDMLEVALDGNNGWLPSVIVLKGSDGTTMRRVIEGWQSTGKTPQYSRATFYQRAPASDSENLRSFRDWGFIEDEKAPDRSAECRLSFYGLPEPSKEPPRWRLALTIGAILAASSLYVVSKLRPA